jgi:DNA helicase-2/ATP-dependent DNA helicase PcrA
MNTTPEISKGINFKEELNQTQYEAVTTTAGPLLVIAGAGSGKTRVIEYRVLNLVQSKINPESILLLTFTRRAAQEMLSRASRHDESCKRVNGGTFHSFAYRMLRIYGKAIDLAPSFSILDESDAEEAINRCAVKLGVYDVKLGKKKKFPKKETLKAIFSAVINKGFPIKDIIQKEYRQFNEYVADIENIRKEYSLYKEAKQYLDYDDLLLYLTFLLKDKEVREEIAAKYQYIMVDEYQDTNRLQGDIVYAIGSKHNNVMAVGDDAQSIYGFRGATHENIMQFPKLFPDCKIVTLEKNYRSIQPILDVANPILENMEKKYPKCLISVKEIKGAKPALNYFANAYEEAEWITEKIEELLSSGVSADEIAVLYRSSYISISLQAELTKRGIPYQVFGGIRFYELAHIKDVMAHLRIIASHKDELAWNRVLMMIQGIGSMTSDKMLAEITACKNIGDVITNVLDKYIKGEHKYSKELARLKALLVSAGKQKTAMVDLLTAVLKYYNPIFEEKFDDWPDRASDLDALEGLIIHYHSLSDFLADMTIDSPSKSDASKDNKNAEKPITLSTIHSAKGLEWDTVFIIGLADGCLPSKFALSDDAELEEEQRLLYVAITRAKNNLFLSMPVESEKSELIRFNKLCRFINAPNVLTKLSENAGLSALY